MKIERRFDIKRLVGELGNNKVDALELLREALSNAKDHGAGRLFIRVKRDPEGRVSLVLMDDGEGLDATRWSAFWGAAATAKSSPSTIGYKGFGTKLFFRCGKLSVASRASPGDPWLIVKVDRPHEDENLLYDAVEMDPKEPLRAALVDAGLFESATGTAIAIDDLLFTDKDHLVSRERIESYCDWFTVLADIRSGLFDTRAAFHRVVKTGGQAIDGIRATEVPVRPIEVQLQVNGDRTFTPLGRHTPGRGFFAAWSDDAKEFSTTPALAMFGHRFADVYAGGVGGTGSSKDDRTALRLTSPDDWVDQNGVAIVAHVEGHRRQRETYLEAGWQNKKGLYTFDDRFGLWLCRDYIPVVQRNDLLRKAIAEAQPRGLASDFKSVRNWKVFVNDQGFLPLANRGDVSNYAERESRIFDAVVTVLRRAFAHKDFSEWIEKLRSARRERERNAERELMARRRDLVVDWVKKQSPGGIDAAEAELKRLTPDESLLMRTPRNEQELFYLYAQLSARFQVPVSVLEYDTHEGVDAIARVHPAAASLLPKMAYARVEFKHEVERGYPINHYFDAIDLIICWRVGKVGPIDEEGAEGAGMLQKRRSPILKPPMDTHEIVYDSSGTERVIPVLAIGLLFSNKAKVSPPKRK